jgi:uncharacterized protein YbcI
VIRAIDFGVLSEAMAMTREEAESGQSLLLQISNAMVRVQKEFFGKGPTRAKSYMFDDMLLVVMREGLTTAEKTMLEFGHPNQVRQFRQLYQDEMTGRLTGMVEELTGRKVINYQSQVLFDPDMTLELFVFDASAEHGFVTATARDEPAQVVRNPEDEPAREPPSASGQEQQ